jgi:hypothetical protein
LSLSDHVDVAIWWHRLNCPSFLACGKRPMRLSSFWLLNFLAVLSVVHRIQNHK